MSNFPNNFDDDTTLPFVNDNITEIGGAAIDALRDAVFAIEQNIGLNAQGTTASIAARFGVAFFPDGTLKPSAITSLGLVTLPITEDQIAPFAQIPESKLRLDHRTQDLFNYIRDLSGDVNLAIGWISTTGIKLEPHLIGAIYRHALDQIDVSADPADFLFNNLRLLRDNGESYKLINDINNELLAHQWADGSPFGLIKNITTNNGSVYPNSYSHVASSVFLNTSRFTHVPQTAEDLQLFAEFVDGNIINQLTTLQNLYSNGISRESRSSSLSVDGYGSPIIPSTPAIAYLKNIGTSSAPFDDINTGDDIIEFKPSAADKANNSFDEKFALVKVGDIVRVNYGTVELPFVIKEKKYVQSGGNKQYVVRIAGKNIMYSPTASARIDKPLFNTNKYGVLAIAAANSGVSTIPSSIIVATARSAQTLGLGFNPDHFDAAHYLLYLALYPTGSPQDGYLILPPIDVTGNQGATPGLYTLNNIVETTNNAFRQIGYNYRFIAYQYQGEFGIALADSYNNAGFSILSAVILPNGNLDSVGTGITFQNNVVGIFPAGVNLTAPDPLGFGPLGAGVASPAFQLAYASPEASQSPTKLFLPLKRNNYYVNGSEREKMNLDVGQALDGYGDGYWVGTIVAQTIIPGSPGTVQTTYRIPLDLAASQLKKGKTIVVQKLDGYGVFPNDFGRFTIADVSLGCCSPSNFTDIKVNDAVHGLATSGSTGLALGVGGQVSIYFSSDSVAFNTESATDFTSVSPFKRHFEVYVDESGNTFTHERGRVNAGNVSPLVVNTVPLINYSELVKMNILKISPKLRGYQFGSVNKITFNMVLFDNATGVYDGYLSSWDGSVLDPVTHKGPLTAGKKGEVTRFYDETNVDYIDVVFDVNTPISTFSNQQIDIQLFPTLSLDNQIMMIGTFQFNDVTNIINYLRDERQFGNISEKEFSTSALSFLSLPERLLHGNGVIRGFDLEDTGAAPNPNAGQIFLTGGEALVNGNFIQLNNETVVIPIIKEFPLFNINWVLCVNSSGEYQPIPLLDFDPSLNTPTNPARIFTAFNLVNGLSYNLDATTFSDIINIRKDLTPLYIIAATTTPGSGSLPPTISLNITDARKYINDADTNLPLRLTSANAQGNFKNPVAILNWIKYNNIFNGTAIVKGADVVTGAINTAINLNFASTVTIEGENDAVLTFNNPVTIGSNLTFKNIQLVFNGGVSINTNVENLIFDNCAVSINISSATPSANNVIFDFVNSGNVNINDCFFGIIYNPLISTPAPLTDITKYGAVFRLNNAANFVMDNSVVNVTFSTVPGSKVPGDMFILINSNGVIIKDSDFAGNFNRFIGNSNSNALRLNNLTVTSTYNPLVTLADFGFSATNFVNSGQGYIYANVNASLNDIVIDNVVFNYSPAGNPISDTSLANRFSFINFELSSTNSMLSNLIVTNCKFNHTNTGGGTEDVRPAIAIVNTYSASGSPTLANAQQPILLNARFVGNVCNRNQSIIVTSRLDASGLMSYPGLTAQNCVVRDNVCGTIGYWTSASTKVISIPPNVNTLTDKTSGLTIENNLCHLITNLDHTGKYFLVSKLVSSVSTNQTQYPSGYCLIKGNRCNWIHTGVSFDESSYLEISGNALNAYDPLYITQFNDLTPNIYGPSTGYAIFVSSNKHVITPAQTPGEGNDSAVLITGNAVGSGYWYQTTGSATTYKYPTGYIFCQSSSTITKNILKGITTSGGDLILVGGSRNIVTNNQIYRQGSTITSYVAFNNYELPQWGSDPGGNGANSTGIVVDNFFDSPFISDSTLSETLVILPAAAINRWIVQRNKNQTGFVVVPLTNHALFDTGQWGPNQGNIGATTRIGLMNDGSGDTGAYKSPTVLIIDNAGAVQRFWGFQDNIEKYLPNNVRVIQIKGGLRPYETVLDFFTTAPPSGHISSNFYLNLSSLVPTTTIDWTNTNYFSSSSSNDTAINEVATPVYSVVTGGQINSTFFNVPFLINLENYIRPDTGAVIGDISYSYITGQNKNISLVGDWRWFRLSSTMHISLSPLQIKYRW